MFVLNLKSFKKIVVKWRLPCRIWTRQADQINANPVRRFAMIWSTCHVQIRQGSLHLTTIFLKFFKLISKSSLLVGFAMIWQSKAQNGICAEDLNQIWLEVDLFEWEFSWNLTRNIVFQDDVRKTWPSKAKNGTCAQDLNQIWSECNKRHNRIHEVDLFEYVLSSEFRKLWNLPGGEQKMKEPLM